MTVLDAVSFAEIASPDEIPGLHSWFDASQIVGKSAGDSISQWNDVKGAHHALQATGGQQPKYQLEGGLPAVVFDGVDDGLSTAGFTAVAQPYTCIAVYRPSRGLQGGTNTWDETAVGAGGTSSSFLLQARTSNGMYGSMIGNQFGTFSYGGVKTNEYRVHALCVRPNGTNAYSHSYMNGEKMNAGIALGTSNVTSLHLGWTGIATLASQHRMTGSIREVVFYNRELDTNEMIRVSRYLHHKWGVVWPRETPPVPVRATFVGKIGLVTQLRRTTYPSGASFGSADRLAQCRAIKMAGVDWVRELFDWSRMNPSNGVWDFSVWDSIVTAAATAGLNVLGILGFPPTWESGGADKFRPPADNAHFADFVTRVVARYGTGGTFWTANPTVPVMPVVQWEMWNEPWLYHFWLPNPSPTNYAALARAGTVAAHAADANAKVLLVLDRKYNNADATQGDWLQGIYNADPTLLDLVDAYASHAYPLVATDGAYFELGNGFADPQRVAAQRDDLVFLGKSKPWQITEIGWSTADPSVSGVSEATQASFWQQTMRRTAHDWSAWLDRTYLYAYDFGTDVLTGATAWNDNLPVLHADGTPKPALAALASWLTAT